MERTTHLKTDITLSIEITLDPVKWQNLSTLLLGSARAGIFVDIAPPVVDTNDQPFWTRQWRKGHKR